MDEKDLYEDIISELFDEIERAQKESEDYIRHDMKADVTLVYALGLMKAVRIIRDKRSESTPQAAGVSITPEVAPVQQ